MAGALAIGASTASPTAAQEPFRPIAASLEARPPIDTTTLAFEETVEMTTLLEKTIFKVDVLRLRILIGNPEGRELGRIAGSSQISDREDSAAMVALAARDVWAVTTFERNIGLDQFVDGVLGNLRRAVDAGAIRTDEYDLMRDSLPVWYDFLRLRGIHDGDRMLYRIRGPSLRTIFVGVDGEVWLDQLDRGASPPRILIAGYFARGSDLRNGLIESLLAANHSRATNREPASPGPVNPRGSGRSPARSPPPRSGG